MPLGDEDDKADVEMEEDIKVGVMVSGGTRVTCIYLTLSFSAMFVLNFGFPGKLDCSKSQCLE